MNAAIIFSGTGPILVLTSYPSIENPRLIEKLASKGIKKFIAYEIPDNLVKEKYGMHYNAVMGDLQQQDDLRVMDYDGHHIFSLFSLKTLGQPKYFE